MATDLLDFAAQQRRRSRSRAQEVLVVLPLEHPELALEDLDHLAGITGLFGHGGTRSFSLDGSTLARFALEGKSPLMFLDGAAAIAAFVCLGIGLRAARLPLRNRTRSLSLWGPDPGATEIGIRGHFPWGKAHARFPAVRSGSALAGRAAHRASGWPCSADLVTQRMRGLRRPLHRRRRAAPRCAGRVLGQLRSSCPVHYWASGSPWLEGARVHGRGRGCARSR